MKQLNVEQYTILATPNERPWWNDTENYCEHECSLNHAITEIHVEGSAQIKKVFPYSLGDDFEEDVFHWMVELDNGNIAHIWGSCGAYTGWEIGGMLQCDEYASLEDAFHNLGMAQKDVNGVPFKEIFYRELFDKIMDEEIETMLTEDYNTNTDSKEY